MKRFSLGLCLVLLFTLPAIGHTALGDYFVTTDWLAKNRTRVMVVDVRREPFYLFGHILGAQHVARAEFLATRNRVKELLPKAATIGSLLSRLGVTATTPVVVYAEADNPYAARLVWTLRYYGHRQSYVLDGGYGKWSAEDRATRMRPSARPQPSKYLLPQDARSYLRADADYLSAQLGNPGVIIWDTRETGEFDGRDVQADRGGHIPGAVHLDWNQLLTEINGSKVLKSRAEIIPLLQQQGLTADKEIIPYCQTGVRSAYASLVLLGLGYNRVRNYDGSWLEWADNPTLPIINAQGQLEGSIQTHVDSKGVEKANQS